MAKNLEETEKPQPVSRATKFDIGNRPFYRAGVTYPARSIVELQKGETPSKHWTEVGKREEPTDPNPQLPTGDSLPTPPNEPPVQAASMLVTPPGTDAETKGKRGRNVI